MKNIVTWIGVLLLVTGCAKPPDGSTGSAAASASAAPLDSQAAAEEGFKLYDVEPTDKAGAVRLWEPACAAGNTLACAGMGIAHTFGTGGKTKDEKKGLTFIEPACTKGEQRACQVLARFHYFGWGGVPKDINKGRDLWKKACDAGEARGCYFLALVLSSKDGPPEWRDVAEGKRLYDLSCRLDYKDGCEGAKKLDAEARVEKLREKVTRKFADRDKDNECLGKGFPPYRWEYGGGTFAEDREVAESDGCKKLHYSAELQVYCCPRVPSSF